jgi:hypothetical protein
MRTSRLSLAADGRILHSTGSFIKDPIMELRSQAPVLALGAGEVVTLDGARGVRIQARAGMVWVTQEADSRDHVLGAGETVVVSRDGRIVIQALQASSVALAPAANDARDGVAA